MKVEVVTPEDYVGNVIGDLNGRRGQIQGQETRGVAVVINAMVPLANMFKYVDNLRSMSPGPRRSTRCSSTTMSRCRPRSPRKSEEIRVIRAGCSRNLIQPARASRNGDITWQRVNSSVTSLM